VTHNPPPGHIVTVIKLDPQGNEKIRYQGTILERVPNGVIIEASWTLPARDLGYTSFEPGDRFTEYYYTDRWYNIFDIANPVGQRKGWYCNVTEPARILEDHIEQVDLFLDAWINPTGEILILDEDEFAEATLSNEQRNRAHQGLQALLYMIEQRQEMFSEIRTQGQ